MEQIDYDIDDFMNYCEVKNLSKKTIASYEQTLRLFAIFLKTECKVKDAESVKELHIREYIKNLQERGKYTVVTNANTKKVNFPENRQDYKKEISKTTINNYIRNIKVFFNYMYENRYINNNPIKRVRQLKNQRKVVGYIDDTNMNKLLKNFDLSKFHEYRDYTIAQLIFDTGMRIGETLLIKETDIDYVKRSVILPADNTKGKKDRYVFFSAEMLKQLKRWLQYKDRYKQCEYVFCTTKGTNLKISNYETNFKKYGERIGKKDIHPHMLRNNFAKRFLMGGGEIYTLSKIFATNEFEESIEGGKYNGKYEGKRVKRNSKRYEKKTIEIKIKGIITIEFVMHKVECRYNQRSGTLSIYDKYTDKKISIEIYMACMLKTNENKEIIQISMENEEDIMIHII